MRTADNFIVEAERKRRREAYGVEAKLKHLYLLLTVASVLFVVAQVRLWWYARPSEHVLIDHVLVEVVPEETLAHLVGTLSGWAGLLAATGIAFYRLNIKSLLLGGPSEDPVALTAPASVPTASSEKKVATTVATSIKPLPSRMSNDLWWCAGQAASFPVPSMSALSSDKLNPFQGQAIRSDDELQALLSRDAHVPNANMTILGGSDIFGGAGSIGNSNGATGIAVRYGVEGGQEGKSRHAVQTASAELAALGVGNTDRSIMKLKEWISQLCKSAIDDIDKCDAWFAAQRIKTFDCSNPLSDLFDVVPSGVAAPAAGGFGAPAAGGFGAPAGGGFGAPATGGGFGAPAAGGFGAPAGGGFGAPAAGGFGGQRQTGGFGGSQATVERVKKSVCLERERSKVQCQQAGDMSKIELLTKLDLRLSLERILDISITFPSTSSVDAPPAAIGRRQRGILNRLRTFATQPSFSSFRSSSEDPDIPADPYLIAHFLRTKCTALAPYIQLAYHSSSYQSKDIVLYIGGNGEPCFFVKHRHGGQEKTMRTTEGVNSLFEGLLLFFAVVRRYYRGSYGNVEGVVDLQQLKLDGIF